MREAKDIYKILENRLKFLAKTDIAQHLVWATHIPKGSYIYYASVPNRVLVVDRGTNDARSADAWERVGRRVKPNYSPVYIMASNNDKVGVKGLFRYEDTEEIYPRYRLDYSQPIIIGRYTEVGPILEDDSIRRVIDRYMGYNAILRIRSEDFKSLCVELNRIGRDLDTIFGIDRTWKK